MLIVGFSGINIGSLLTNVKYNDKIIGLDLKKENITNDVLIDYIEQIRESLANFEIVIIPYIQEIILCLDTLAIKYTLVYPTEMDKTRIGTHTEEYQVFKTLAIKNDSIVLKVGESLEQKLKEQFEWINLEEKPEEVKQEIKQEEVKQESKEDETAITETEQKQKPQVLDGKKITLQELIEQDIDITEADVREMKAITNKFKVAMILQAKSRLHTVLKLCGVLDKLYDELVDRIDLSLKTTDTASLMYTADYISKALSETNQFIMSLITNEKIQNFFIIDNSNIINITDNKVDIDKREKIRKAAEIVLDNADYFTNGQYDKVIDPNSVFDVDEDNDDVSEGNSDASTTT